MQNTETKRPYLTEEGLEYSDAPSGAFGGMHIPHIQVLKSAAGYYIGDLYEEMEGMWFPYSRDSACYWRTREEAEKALISGDYPVKF